LSIDIFEIKKELVIFLRNNISDSRSPIRISNETEYFSGDNSKKVFELVKDLSRNSNHLVKNVHYIKVNGTPLTNYTNYTFKYQGENNGKVTFVTAPDNSSSNNIEINYDWGLAWIFTDLPRTEITPTNLPRISLELLSAPSAEIAMGAQVLKSPMSISMTIMSNSVFDLDNLTKEVRDSILNNRTGFHNIGIITEPRLSPTIIFGDAEAYMFQRTIDWTIPDTYEFFQGTC